MACAAIFAVTELVSPHDYPHRGLTFVGFGSWEICPCCLGTLVAPRICGKDQCEIIRHVRAIIAAGQAQVWTEDRSDTGLPRKWRLGFGCAREDQ